MHEPIAGEVPALELLEVAFDTPQDRSSDDRPARSASPKWRIALALAIAAGLTISAAALLRDPGPAAVATPSQAVDTAPAPPEGIAGFAELFVSTYLTAGGSDRPEQLRVFYAAAPEPALTSSSHFIRHVAVLGVHAAGGRSWELHVAADVLVHDGVGYQSDGIHHYLVGVVAAGHGFAATSLPIRIATPPPAAIAAVDAGADVADAGLAALVDGFLAAYLTGNGDLRRFVAPDAPIAAVAPPPFSAITVDRLTGVALDASSLKVHVLATGHTATTELRVEYHLLADRTDGVWRIAAMTATP